MEEKGIVLDVAAYSSVISCFCKQGDFTEVFKLHSEMCEKGVKPDIVTYNVMINGLCKWGDMERVRGLFDEIVKKRLIPNKVTYFTIVECKCGDLDIAEEFALMCIAAQNAHSAGKPADLGNIDPCEQPLHKKKNTTITIFLQMTS